MLSEYVVNDTVGAHVIVGVGLNVNSEIVTSDALYSATSLKEESGATYDLETLRKDIIDAIFERWFKTSKKCDRRKLAGVWKYYSETIGADVEILVEDERLVGKAIGLTDDFELILETEQGRKTISVGDCRTLRTSAQRKREQEV